MRQLSLKEIQNVSIEVLKEFHNFCTTNELHYSLAYGTLLGAVRHNGIIPWDDDVDVMMPRPDFDRFFELYKDSPKFKAFHPRNTYLNFGRLCEMKDTQVVSNVPWKKKSSGIWIDIFPIDCVPDNHDEFLQLYKYCHILEKKQMRRRKLKNSFWRMNAKYRFLSFVSLFDKKSRTLESIRDEHDSLLVQIPFGTTNHCSQLAATDNCKEYFPLQMMKEYIDVDFEGMQLRSIKDYDAYLRHIYNDYMQLPPEDQRIPQQYYIKFYWR